MGLIWGTRAWQPYLAGITYGRFWLLPTHRYVYQVVSTVGVSTEAMGSEARKMPTARDYCEGV